MLMTLHVMHRFYGQRTITAVTRICKIAALKNIQGVSSSRSLKPSTEPLQSMRNERDLVGCGGQSESDTV